MFGCSCVTPEGFRRLFGIVMFLDALRAFLMPDLFWASYMTSRPTEMELFQVASCFSVFCMSVAGMLCANNKADKKANKIMACGMFTSALGCFYLMGVREVGYFKQCTWAWPVAIFAMACVHMAAARK